MPKYEYACKACGVRLEVVQSFSDRPLRKHESCGGELQKVFHPAGVVFKGPGFYVTDSRKSSGSSSKSPGSKSPGSKSSGSSSKSSGSKSSGSSSESSSSSSEE